MKKQDVFFLLIDAWKLQALDRSKISSMKLVF